MRGHRTGYELQGRPITRLAAVIALVAATFVVIPPAEGIPASGVVDFEFTTSIAPEATSPHFVAVVLDVGVGNTLDFGFSVDVTVAVPPGTATDPADYTIASNTITFLAGDADGLARTIDVTIVGDLVDEPDETIELELTNLQNATGTSAIGSTQTTHQVTILDDDFSVAFQSGSSSQLEGDSGSVGKTVRVVLTTAAPLTTQATVPVVVGAGSTATPTTDYTGPTNATATFPIGSTSGDFHDVTVTVNGDTTPESDETVILGFGTPSEGGTVGATPVHTLTITNDDSGNVPPGAPNVPPDASIQITDQAGNASIEFGVGEFVKVTVTFTDPGTEDTHNVTFDWGDGTAPDVLEISPVGARSIVRSHAYTSANLYQISISVSDSNGESDTVTGFVSVTDSSVGSAYKTGLVDTTQGKWHLLDNAGVEVTSFFYGNPGDLPFMGDWDGDGIETPGLYRQVDGFVYLRNFNTRGIADVSFFFGNPGDVPIAGDFNGNGFDTVSIYRPSSQTFYIINDLGEDGGELGAAEFSYVFGNPGDNPFVGDFDGDGVETVGLHRESTGLVYFRNSHSQGNADNEFVFGNPGDHLIAGDWTGDGVFTPAVFRPSSTTMFFKYTNSQGNADNQYIPSPAGTTWLPVSGVTGF